MQSDWLFQQMLTGVMPSALSGGMGTLDAAGNTVAILAGGPALAPVLGWTLHFIALSYDSLTGVREISYLRELEIVP